MLVYKDIFTDDEVMSDSMARKPVEDDEGNVIEGLFQVESRMVTVGGDNIDVGCGDAFGGGGADEGADDTVEKENNVISERAGFGYTEMPLSKAEFKEYIKGYVQRVRGHMKANGVEGPKIKAFMAEAQIVVKFLLSKFKDLEFYMNRSMDCEAGLIYAIYVGEAVSPNFMYFTHGLKEEKF